MATHFCFSLQHFKKHDFHVFSSIHLCINSDKPCSACQYSLDSHILVDLQLSHAIFIFRWWLWTELHEMIKLFFPYFVFCLIRGQGLSREVQASLLQATILHFFINNYLIHYRIVMISYFHYHRHSCGLREAFIFIIINHTMRNPTVRQWTLSATWSHLSPQVGVQYGRPLSCVCVEKHTLSTQERKANIYHVWPQL